MRAAFESGQERVPVPAEFLRKSGFGRVVAIDRQPLQRFEERIVVSSREDLDPLCRRDRRNTTS